MLQLPCMGRETNLSLSMAIHGSNKSSMFVFCMDMLLCHCMKSVAFTTSILSHCHHLIKKSQVAYSCQVRHDQTIAMHSSENIQRLRSRCLRSNLNSCLGFHLAQKRPGTINCHRRHCRHRRRHRIRFVQMKNVRFSFPRTKTKCISSEIKCHSCVLEYS